MERTAVNKVINLEPYLPKKRQTCPQSLLYRVLALWTQYACVGTLALYALLRLILCPGTPVGMYSGPLALLWAAAFLLLLTSYVADLLLWRE